MLDFGWTFVFTILNVIVLFIVLRALLFKPLTNFMEQRSRKIKDALEESVREKARAQELRDQMDGIIRETAVKAEGMINDAKARAEKIRLEGVENTKLECEAMKEGARRLLESEVAEARLRLKDEVAALAMVAAAKILEREVPGGRARS
jgi:F-type H+-transporting ATPase subunit b